MVIRVNESAVLLSLYDKVCVRERETQLRVRKREKVKEQNIYKFEVFPGFVIIKSLSPESVLLVSYPQ